jgi:hypothetical protein
LPHASSSSPSASSRAVFYNKWVNPSKVWATLSTHQIGGDNCRNSWNYYWCLKWMQSCGTEAYQNWGFWNYLQEDHIRMEWNCRSSIITWRKLKNCLV